jgi:hypothetical protein
VKRDTERERDREREREREAVTVTGTDTGTKDVERHEKRSMLSDHQQNHDGV